MCIIGLSILIELMFAACMFVAACAIVEGNLNWKLPPRSFIK
jgi:hypothetical protein